jgi:hypothetical protein
MAAWSDSLHGQRTWLRLHLLLLRVVPKSEGCGR